MARNFPNGAIFLFDRNLRYIVADGQGLGRSGSGHSRDSLEGKTIWEALSPEDCVTVEPMYRNALAGVEQSYEIPYRDRTYFCQTVPVKNEAGEIIAGMVVTQDITDRKQAELELQQAKEAAEAASLAKSAFLANMSHELRSPLNAILGFAQLMSSSPTLPAEHQRHVSIITRSGEHLLTLINDVLDLAKVEANRTTLNEQDFDLYKLLDDVEQMFRLQAQSKGLQLIVDRGDAVPQYVRTDAVKLRQVLINLLSNAIKFTAEGGVSLLVQLSSPHAQIYFEVSDTGAGIAPEELDRIFEAFVQSSTRKQSVEGTGLGLPISRAFVQLMGGEITVRSVVGQGSTFSFDIRVSVVEATALKTQPSTRRVTALEPNQPRYRILIVDDKADNRQLLVQLLSPFGFELKEARNGAEAIEIWQHFEPELILMDVRMPVMDGYEAAQQIRATANGQAPVIIAVSASLSMLETVTTEAGGFDDFIRKPFRNADIFAAMSQHLGVRFAGEDASVAANSPQTKAVRLQRTDLAEFPPDLVAKLHQATVEGDFELMLALVTELRSYNEPVADTLESLARQLQYRQLLDLTEPSVTEETEIIEHG
jgi:PAS domain S-box-containing protein